MATKAEEVLKRFEQLQAESDEPEKEHSLQENAKQRAQHPDQLHAGTAYDWEEIEAYKKELERMEREGPGTKKP